MMGAHAGLWAASATIPPVDAPPLDGEQQVDVAIIGGGFTGLSAALHLAEGGRAVALVEAHEIGFGASGRNGGQVNPGLKHDEASLIRRFGEVGRRFYRLGQEAPGFLAELVTRRGLRCGFARPGLIRLAHNAPAFAKLREAGAALRAGGIAARDIGAEEVTERVGTRRYAGGLIDPRGAQVQPLELVREMARVSKEAGVELFARSPVRSLARSSGRWRVSSDAGALLANRVIIATNAYTDGLVPGLARTVLPVNSFQIATAPLTAAQSGAVLPGGETVYDSRRLVLYFRKSADGRVVLGGRASFSTAGQLGTQTADYAVLENVLHGIFPQLRGIAIEHRWTGLVGITLDSLPHYHELPDGLHILLGFNGRGVALSHRAGAWLARKILGLSETCEIPATPITPIPLHRFRAPLLHCAMQLHRVLDLIGR